MLGGGNVKKLKEFPPGSRAGDNANAFVGGFRLWAQERVREPLIAGNLRVRPKKAPGTTARVAPAKRARLKARGRRRSR